MTKYKMPERQPGDGDVKIRRHPGAIEVEVTTCHKTESIMMSEYNAWRLFGMLSCMLDLPLPKAVGKAIVLTDPSPDGWKWTLTLG